LELSHQTKFLRQEIFGMNFVSFRPCRLVWFGEGKAAVSFFVGIHKKNSVPATSPVRGELLFSAATRVQNS
jgi:hypothetical protein